MKDKKGQGGMSTEVLVGLLILLVVAVVLVFSFTQTGKDFWSKVTGSRGGTTLDAAISGCQTSASVGSRDAFCSELKEVTINGERQYVTCNYIKDKLSSAIDCDTKTYLPSVIKNCEANKQLKVKVNGVTINALTDCASIPA